MVLTNHAGLWQPASRVRIATYDAFRIDDGREVAGTLNWGETAGAGTRIGREHPIPLLGTYRCSWRDFSNVESIMLRYLCLPVAAPDGS